MRSKKRAKRSDWPIFLAGFILLLFAVYGFNTIRYLDHFMPKTTVNGVDISGKTVDEANSLLNKKMGDSEFVITDNHQPWETFSRKELNLKVDFKQALETAMHKQASWLWLIRSSKTIDINNLTDASAEVNSYVDNLKGAITNLNNGRTETKNATITKGTTSFVINPEVSGNELDVDKILEVLKQDIHSGKSTLELEDYTKTPSITSSDPELKTKLEDMNKLAEQTLTYKINDKTVDVPRETLMEWLEFDGEEITLNKDNVKKYITQLGQTYNTSSNPTPFQSTLRGEVSVPAGTYSWTIDSDKEVEQVTKDVLEGKGFSRSPIIKGSAPADKPFIGKTYVEVDLINQHMWYYKDGALVLETDVVTGKPSTPTPAGVFYIWNKESPSILVGEDYRTPVQYWMPVDWNGVGIHDSNWQPAYGGNLHLTAGSHGCVNTPPGICGQLYNSVEIGTPVLIF